MLASPAQAEPNFPITSGQQATAQQVAQAGVPLSELAPNAPDVYIVKKGDTLWDISRVFLKSPWRWPELWGMNMQQIRNPHLIFPGQALYLIKGSDGRARLSTTMGGGGSDGVIRVSPGMRTDSLSSAAITTLRPGEIQAFTDESVVMDEDTFQNAPRIVSALSERVIAGVGERVYARSSTAEPLTMDEGKPVSFRLSRDSRPVVDPETGEVLGYEGLYVGRASLLGNEQREPDPDYKAQEESGNRTPAEQFSGLPSERSAVQINTHLVIPAPLEILSVKQEVLVGDRLMAEPDRELMNYIPRAPEDPTLEARVASIHGDGRLMAGSHQVVALNKGKRDGIDRGYVFSLLTNGAVTQDRTQQGGRTKMRLPDEQNGYAIVFRTFDRVSYALVIESKTGTNIGDRLVYPF